MSHVYIEDIGRHEGEAITIKAKTPGRAILSGAMALPPAFARHQGVVYKAAWALKNLRGDGTGTD